ncbi:MAG: NnrS family protein [Acidobacteriota bacterium]|nr:NnrS family protein [Acidobacteriota bacterium]
MSKITGSMSIAEILKICPSARRIFDEHGLKGCGGANGPAEPLEFFASVHEADLDALLEDLNAEIEKPAQPTYVYQESLADYIYRRFFKTAIVIVLSLGGLWGVIALMQISLGKSMLQPDLLPAIHAHAHAMIFGWVGLFVMGFAYQSFPRFKVTTLWRPRLANFTLYLMIIGILARVSGDMLEHGALALGLGAASAALEITAIVLFLTIILKTARQSMSPRNPYEVFIIAALGWFLIQAIFSGFFFYAETTAQNLQETVLRTALLDGPLRDIQLLGFAALIIAGVSQRFVPVVYGLGEPRHDRQRLIFWLMNGSLVLDVASYVALLTTGDPIFGFTLELSYLLMVLWAVLLVVQLRVFTRTTQSDRSWKFIRAAFIWLLIAMVMMPLLMPYSSWIGEGFSHAFWGAHRHAFTVGFVSMMILGISSRVVPILAGVDSRKLTVLWGPFILLNVGCAGRVALEILTDLRPGIAYSLIGITGFMELAALAWWGVELWRVMNLSKTHRTSVLRVPIPMEAR